MDFFTAVNQRHSYRGEFLAQSVPRDDLEKIVRAGIVAPSGCNGQTTAFVIIDDSAIMDALRGIVTSSVMKTAPNAIVVCSEDREVFKGISFEKEDYSAAVENMLLAITALGYASVWIDGALRVDDRAQQIAALLQIPPSMHVNVILPLGVPVVAGQQKEKKPFDQRACWNRWNA